MILLNSKIISPVHFVCVLFLLFGIVILYPVQNVFLLLITIFIQRFTIIKKIPNRSRHLSVTLQSNYIPLGLSSLISSLYINTWQAMLLCFDQVTNNYVRISLRNWLPSWYFTASKIIANASYLVNIPRTASNLMALAKIDFLLKYPLPLARIARIRFEVGKRIYFSNEFLQIDGALARPEFFISVLRAADGMDPDFSSKRTHVRFSA